MKRLLGAVIAIALVLVGGVSAQAVNSPYAATISNLFNSNEAVFAQDNVNTNLGRSFNMHFLSTVTISGTIWGYYIKVTPAGKLGIGLAKSTNGTSWTDHGLVLDVGPTGSWDSGMASFPGVWYEGGTFYLTYEGSNATNGGNIGLATSTNGTTFTKQGEILTHNSTGWESQNIGTPSLYKVGSTWYLYYHGFDGVDCRVGVATGTSLYSLTKHSANPIINTSASGWDAGTVGKRDITYENGYYYMVYEGSTDLPYNTAKWSSGLARSTDLINWTKYSQNPILPTTAGDIGYDGPNFLTLSGKTWIYYREEHPTDSSVTRRASIVNELNGGFTAQWEAESSPMQHQIGRADGDGWSANTLDPVGFLTYGPYTTTVNDGENTAVFKLMIDNNSADNAPIVTIDAFDFTTNQVLASRTITRQQFTSTFHYEFFILPFRSPSTGNTVEFRVHWKKNAFVKQDRVALLGAP